MPRSIIDNIISPLVRIRVRWIDDDLERFWHRMFGYLLLHLLPKSRDVIDIVGLMQICFRDIQSLLNFGAEVRFSLWMRVLGPVRRCFFSVNKVIRASLVLEH